MVSFNEFYLLQEMPWASGRGWTVDFHMELPDWADRMIKLMRDFKNNDVEVRNMLKAFYDLSFKLLFVKKFKDLSKEKKEELKSVLPHYFLQDMGVE